MPNKRIEEYVSENREEINRVDSQFLDISASRDSTLSFSDNIINVVASIQVYKRNIDLSPIPGDWTGEHSLISGHPNGDKHGSAHGQSGHFHDSWTLVTDNDDSEIFTISGRNALRDTLTGEITSRVNENAIGDAPNPLAVYNDTQLQSRTASRSVWTEKPSNNQLESKSIFFSTHHNENITEYGILDSNGTLLTRLTTSEITPTLEEEIRVDITLTFTGYTNRNSSFTNEGEKVVVDSLRQESVVTGVNKVAFGSGTTDPADTDTSLENQQIEKDPVLNKKPSRLTAEAYLFEDEPASQPFDMSEVGVLDQNGRLLWRAVMDPVTKDSDVRIETFVTFKVL